MVNRNAYREDRGWSYKNRQDGRKDKQYDYKNSDNVKDYKTEDDALYSS